VTSYIGKLLIHPTPIGSVDEFFARATIGAARAAGQAAFPRDLDNGRAYDLPQAQGRGPRPSTSSGPGCLPEADDHEAPRGIFPVALRCRSRISAYLSAWGKLDISPRSPIGASRSTASPSARRQWGPMRRAGTTKPLKIKHFSKTRARQRRDFADLVKIFPSPALLEHSDGSICPIFRGRVIAQQLGELLRAARGLCCRRIAPRSRD
jgi:hypothetical protein